MFKYRRLWSLTIRPIFTGLHHQLYPNEFVNYSLEWDVLKVTLMELGRTTMAVSIRFYSNMAILKNGAKTNIIRILLMHAYLRALSDLDLY